MLRPLALVAAALALAGCVEVPAAQDAPAASPPALPQRLDFVACDHQEGFFGIPMAQAEAWMPEGFRPRPLAGDLAGFFVSAFECGHTEGDAPRVDAPRVLWAGLSVVPPDEYANDSLDFTGLLLGSVHEHPATRDVFDAWAQGTVLHGPVGLEWTLPGDRVAHGRAYVDAPGARLDVRTQVGPATDHLDVLHARFFAVREGAVVGAMDLDAIDHAVVIGGATLGPDPEAFGLRPDATAAVGFHGPVGTLSFSWRSLDDIRRG